MVLNQGREMMFKNCEVFVAKICMTWRIFLVHTFFHNSGHFSMTFSKYWLTTGYAFYLSTGYRMTHACYLYSYGTRFFPMLEFQFLSAVITPFKINWILNFTFPKGRDKFQFHITSAHLTKLSVSFLHTASSCCSIKMRRTLALFMSNNGTNSRCWSFGLLSARCWSACSVWTVVRFQGFSCAIRRHVPVTTKLRENPRC